MKSFHLPRRLVPQQLERDPLFECSIGPDCRVDLAHTAAPDQILNAPWSQIGAMRQRWLENRGLRRMGRRIQNARGIVRAQELVNLAMQGGIAGARARQ
ncbi:MAG TPA: hypothetical protein VLK83_03965, partial [Rhodanobacteraceae bacterium]|nr:hypothetical protein [Rhodanobacteraceae bacterium]